MDEWEDRIELRKQGRVRQGWFRPVPENGNVYRLYAKTSGKSEKNNDKKQRVKEEEQTQEPMAKDAPSLKEQAKTIFAQMTPAERSECLLEEIDALKLPQPERDYLHDQRTREEMPDPTKPAGANVNKINPQASLRLPKKTLEGATTIAKKQGRSRNQWMQEAIEQRLALEKTLGS